jgi:hypothetical protein
MFRKQPSSGNVTMFCLSRVFIHICYLDFDECRQNAAVDYHTDRSAPSIIVPYRQGPIRTKSREEEFEPSITFWVSCDRPFKLLILQARRSKKWTREVEEEGEGDSRKRRGTLHCIFFLRIESCGFRRDSGQPAFLSSLEIFLFIYLFSN